MNTQNTANSSKNTMTLREPKKKRRVRLRPGKPFPINIGPDIEWIVYTGHLSSLGVYITDPDEIQALHSMGFFGKGSLSRSHPNFERTRSGVPPVVRQRQWARRQGWLEQAETLAAQGYTDECEDKEWEDIGQLDSEENIDKEKQIPGETKKPHAELDVGDVKTNKTQSENEEIVAKDIEAQYLDESITPPEKKFKHSSSDANKSPHQTGSLDHGDTESMASIQSVHDIVIAEAENEKLNPNVTEIVTAKLNASHITDKGSLDVKVDEVVLSSSDEEDEICEISNIEATEPTAINTSCDKDIILLNEEEMGIDLEKNYDEAENKETNTEYDIEVPEKEMLVLPDSDSDVENYLSQVKPTIKKGGFPVREIMYLTFEETFFLMFGLGCLQIVDFDGNLLDISEAWNHFCHIQNDFVQKYVVYHYFRSKGWVVKPGLKYGGDFLLYKQGPPFYHASYIVIVEVLEADTFIRDDNKTTRKMTWKKLFGLDRLSETAAKEILFAQVLWPSKIPRSEIPSTPELLAEFTVKELLYRRWIPKQRREEIDLDDDSNE